MFDNSVRTKKTIVNRSTAAMRTENRKSHPTTRRAGEGGEHDDHSGIGYRGRDPSSRGRVEETRHVSVEVTCCLASDPPSPPMMDMRLLG